MNTEPNPNCGGGIGFYVKSNYEFEILEEESVFMPGVYESLWIKVKIDKTSYKIIGNVYRPNTAPAANLNLAISTHCSIISKLMSNKAHAKCAIEIAGDFNLDLLNFQNHQQTNEYFESLLSFGLLPVITKPTRVTHSSATLSDHISVSNKSKLHIAGIILSYISDHYPTFYIDQTKVPQPKSKPYISRKINKETQNSFNDLLKNSSFQNIMVCCFG